METRNSNHASFTPHPLRPAHVHTRARSYVLGGDIYAASPTVMAWDPMAPGGTFFLSFGFTGQVTSMSSFVILFYGCDLS